MSKSISLKLDEVRAVFRLVGECRELGHDPILWQLRMAEGLVTLVHTQTVQAGEFRFNRNPSDRPQAIRAMDVGWPSESARRSWVEWQQNLDMPDNPTVTPFLAQPGTRVTLLDLDVITLGEWRMAPFINEWLIPNGLKHGMGSRRQAADDSTHIIMITREVGAKPFGARERALVALLHDELEPHLGKTLTTAANPIGRLSPRVRQVLGALLEGDSEKQIARRLGIAASTLHDHVKALYRHLHLGSRPELMAYFLKRGWKIPGAPDSYRSILSNPPV
jgi:DNA-binding CsgD family transcriptional regulator